MNCCNSYGQCTQAADCCARKADPAQVAPIKRSMPAPQAAPAPARPGRLRRFAGVLGWVALWCITFALLSIPALQLVIAGQQLGDWL